MRLAGIHQGGTVVPALLDGDRTHPLPDESGRARAGDTCEVAVEGIGRLVNTAGDERDGG